MPYRLAVFGVWQGMHQSDSDSPDLQEGFSLPCVLSEAFQPFVMFYPVPRTPHVLVSLFPKQSKTGLSFPSLISVPSLTHLMPPDPALKQLPLNLTRAASVRVRGARFLTAVAPSRFITLASLEPPWFLQNKLPKALVFINLTKDLLTFGSRTHAYPLKPYPPSKRDWVLFTGRQGGQLSGTVCSPPPPGTIRGKPED